MTLELFLALLAHDAYNRGYYPDLPATGRADGLSMPNPVGSKLGNFKVFSTSSIEFPGADEEIGFYAVAYEAVEDGNGFSKRRPDRVKRNPACHTGMSEFMSMRASSAPF